MFSKLIQKNKAQFKNLALLTFGAGIYIERNELIKCDEKIINYFKYGESMIPHPEKKHRGGEDACYSNNSVISVADGVGGWVKYGIDPGIYARQLCSNIDILFKKNANKYYTNPKQLVIDTHSKCDAKGSSTLVVCTLDEKKNKMYTSWVGDSGYLIYRIIKNELKLIYEYKEHQKGYNYPYQLGCNVGDDPSVCAQTDSHLVNHNDIVVVGSDGLLDNLDPNQIKIEIKKQLNDDGNLNDVKKLALNISEIAYTFSWDKSYLSPFCRRAREQYPSASRGMMGGKPDDITVVVAQIKIQQDVNKEENNIKPKL